VPYCSIYQHVSAWILLHKCFAALLCLVHCCKRDNRAYQQQSRSRRSYTFKITHTQMWICQRYNVSGHCINLGDKVGNSIILLHSGISSLCCCILQGLYELAYCESVTFFLYGVWLCSGVVFIKVTYIGLHVGCPSVVFCLSVAWGCYHNLFPGVIRDIQ
jgi:hypothetical protein